MADMDSGGARPVNYLELALPSPLTAGPPQTAGIAEPAALKETRRAVARLSPRLGLCALSEEERARLGVPLSPEERQLALGYLRLARSQPELAAEAGAEAGVLDDVIARDLALAQAETGAALLLSAATRGEQALGAALTERVERVERWIGAQLEDSRVTPLARDRLRIRFGALLELRAQEEAAARARRGKKAAGQKQREAERTASAERLRRARELSALDAAARGEEVEP